jgi:hypothetical protein
LAVKAPSNPEKYHSAVINSPNASLVKKRGVVVVLSKIPAVEGASGESDILWELAAV